MTDLAKFYDKKILKHGLTHKGLDSHSQKSLDKRYEILTAGIKGHESILDIGCSWGVIGMYIKQTLNLDVDYTGIDISKEAIKLGKKERPYLNLIHTSLEDYNPIDVMTGETKQYDLVISQGLFYRLPNTPAGRKRVLELIGKMVKLSSNVRFCALSTWGDDPDNELLIDPVQMLAVIRENLTRNVQLFHHYLPHDVCFYLGREDY